MKKIITITLICGLANIAFSQNFGIDQPSPVEKLDVNGNLRVRGNIFADNNVRISTSGDAKFEYFGSSSDRGFVGWQISTAPVGVHLMNRDNTPIYFSTTNAERMRIDAAGNVGIGTTSPSQKLDVNGIIKGGRTSQMWTSKRTGGVSSASWTTIPGLSINFNLDRAANVQIVANGIQRAVNTCHEGYRKVVDGTVYGDGTHGERINVTRSDVSWWNMWTYGSSVSLPAGNHTISIQTRESGGNSPCWICAESGGSLQGYADCDLIITAVYD